MGAKKKINFYTLFQVAISVLLIFSLFISIGFEKILFTLKEVEILFFFVTGFFSIAPIILSALNFWLLLNLIHKIKFSHFLKYYSYSNALSLIVPGSVGDASIIAFVPKTNADLPSLSLVYILNKSISFIFSILVAVTGGFFLFQFEFRNLLFAGFIILSALIIFVYLFFFKLDFKNNYLKKIKTISIEMLTLLKTNKKKWHFLLYNLLLTIIIWTLVSCAFYYSFKSLNIDIKFIYLCTIPFLASLAGYIPISFAGIGVVEYTAIGLFSTLNISEPHILGTYILLRLWQFSIAFFLLLYFSLFDKKVSNYI